MNVGGGYIVGQLVWRQKYIGRQRRFGFYFNVFFGIFVVKVKFCKIFIGRDKIEDDDIYRVVQGDEEIEEVFFVLVFGMFRGLGWYFQRFIVWCFGFFSFFRGLFRFFCWFVFYSQGFQVMRFDGEVDVFI